MSNQREDLAEILTEAIYQDLAFWKGLGICIPPLRFKAFKRYGKIAKKLPGYRLYEAKRILRKVEEGNS